MEKTQPASVIEEQDFASELVKETVSRALKCPLAYDSQDDEKGYSGARYSLLGITPKRFFDRASCVDFPQGITFAQFSGKFSCHHN